MSIAALTLNAIAPSYPPSVEPTSAPDAPVAAQNSNTATSSNQDNIVSISKEAQETSAAAVSSSNNSGRSGKAASSASHPLTPPTAAATTKTKTATPDQQQAPVRTMSHMIVSYNLQGKIRVKFLDSHNHKIYQIPPEMVAKTEDLMATPKTAADITG